MTNEPHIEPYNITIGEQLPITLEKQLKGKEVRIGEEKGTSVFYSDTVISSITEETVAKIPAIDYSADKYNEQSALNNLNPGLLFENL